MRFFKEGCVEKIPNQELRKPFPKNMWLASSAMGLRMREPCPKPPIFFSALARPIGLRVNWTAAASARDSRWRATALLINRPKKAPALPRP